MNPSGQGVSRTIVNTFLVHNAVAKAQKLGEDLMLPDSVEPLIVKMSEGFLVSIDNELRQLEVRTPMFDCN